MPVPDGDAELFGEVTITLWAGAKRFILVIPGK